jgi:hypothetical protein
MKCQFTKYFKEPTKKYVCLSTSLFFKEKYIKVSKDLKPYNATENKVTAFYNNLKETERMLSDGTYPDHFYLRIYYDKTVFKIEKYKELFKKFKTNPKIQLIEFNCDYFKSDNTFHIDLFGTLLRFYTIFDNESVNMKYCIFSDSDNIFTEHFFTIFKDFEKSKKLVYTFNRINQIGFHGNDYMENNDFFDFIYLLGGLTIIKKNKIFNIKYWTKYFDNMFEQNDLMYIFNYIDFKRYAINGILNKTELKPQSYYSFNYGSDEVWLNYVIKKILIDHKKKDKLDAYILNDYQFYVLLNRLNDLFKYNSIVNIEEFKIFLNDCHFLKEKNKEKEDKNYYDLSKYINQIQNDKNKTIQFFNELKKNDSFHRIYIQNNIKYIIMNIEFLLSKRGQYKFFDITLTK